MAKILIIEDSAYQRGKIRRALEGKGYELLETANGREGLEIAATNTPDCILLDLVMPEIGGVEVLRMLHSQASNIPVLVLTADIQESTRQQCLALGATAFINKPLREDELISAIKQVFDSQEKKEEEAA